MLKENEEEYSFGEQFDITLDDLKKALDACDSLAEISDDSAPVELLNAKKAAANLVIALARDLVELNKLGC